MSKELPRAKISMIDGGEPQRADPQARIHPHVMEMPGIGPVTIFHAEFVFAGETEVDGVRRIALWSGTKGCPCGCGNHGRGIVTTFAPDNARMIAQTLIQLADQYEAGALKAADELIARARGAGQ